MIFRLQIYIQKNNIKLTIFLNEYNIFKKEIIIIDKYNLNYQLDQFLKYDRKFNCIYHNNILLQDNYDEDYFIFDKNIFTYKLKQKNINNTLMLPLSLNEEKQFRDEFRKLQCIM